MALVAAARPPPTPSSSPSAATRRRRLQAARLLAARGVIAANVEQMGSRAAGLFHLRDGKVTKVVLYFDRSAALEAVGLSE